MDVVGGVPDIRPYLGGAEVIAVPIRMGGGTRFKVVEALSMGKPIVSTTLGSEGLPVCDHEHLLLADDPVTFAERIVELFEDPSLRLRLGRSGRSLAERSFSWQLSGDRLDALYSRMLADRTVSNRSAGRLEPVHA
ncbi:MAG: glycosyltransferase [Solirubrobacterales bacterium]|nr:glycosyltransferase [Solirubrobacterales bacterium]